MSTHDTKSQNTVSKFTFNEHESSLLRTTISQIVERHTSPDTGSTSPKAMNVTGGVEYWMNQIRDMGSSEPVAAVAISIMHHLERLNLVVDHTDPCDNYGYPVFFWQIMTNLGKKPESVFPRLVHFGYDNRRRRHQEESANIMPLPTLSITPILQLPSIKSIELRLLDSDTKSLLAEDSTSSSVVATLESITLVTTQLSHLETLLSLAPNLSRLRFTLVRDVSTDSSAWVDADALREILLGAPCAKQLREVAVEIYWHRSGGLDYDQWDNWGGHLCGIDGRLGPLVGLERLDTLETAMQTLLGSRNYEPTSRGLVGMIPTGLKRLKISHDWYVFDGEYSWEDEELPSLIEDLLAVWEPGEALPDAKIPLEGINSGLVDDAMLKHVGGGGRALEEIIVYDESQDPDPHDYLCGLDRLGTPERDLMQSSCQQRGVGFKVEGRRRKIMIM